MSSDWESLRDVLHAYGYTFYEEKFMKRRIDVCMRMENAGSYDAYRQLFSAQEQVRQRFAKEMAIHVTEFFRDPTVWQSLQEKVIPLLPQHVHVWSAGCSYGLELISFAILLKEAGKQFTILGTDIDEPTLQKARSGIYEDLSGISPSYTKYFVGNKVGADILSCVTYQKHDLLADAFPTQQFDIIFCRNTVIYFTRTFKEQLYVQFFKNLKPQGFFVLGKTEILLGDARQSFALFDVTNHIFRKE
ncbi:MAG: CheR family methyltransferase [Candidatus Woesearchaeota archaeon]